MALVEDHRYNYTLPGIGRSFGPKFWGRSLCPLYLDQKMEQRGELRMTIYVGLSPDLHDSAAQ